MPMKKYGKRSRRYSRKSRGSGSPGTSGALARSKVSKSLQRSTYPRFARSKYQLTIAPRLQMAGTFPTELFTSHRYVDTLDINTDNVTGLSPTATVWNLNSLYAPKASGGHQPLGTDQIKQIYSHYVVYKADVSVRVVNIEDASACGIVRVQPNDGYGTGFSIGNKFPWECAEQPNCVVIGGNVNGAGDTWNQSFYIADIEGVPRSQIFNDSYYMAPLSASPTKLSKLEVTCGSFSGLEGSVCRMLVQITYYARWNGKFNLVGS